MRAGIVGYGVYIPIYRIKIAEIAKVWGGRTGGLGLEEKSVAGPDEDTATMAVEATRNALARAQVDPKDIGAVYVGTESPPYAVKPAATIVAEAIGATPETTAADWEFACKAGTAAVQACMGLVLSGVIKYGVAVGADNAQCRPGDALEYTAAAGAASYIIGKEEEALAIIEGTYSYTTDTPDFWRREGKPYPAHGGRFTGRPAYFKHIISAAEGLMRKFDLSVDDFDYAVFHQPNAKFPLEAAKELGLPKEKVLPGLVVGKIGNTYSASSMMGLAAVLDKAEAGQRILMVSYGSGAGSDAFSLLVTERIKEKRNLAPTVEHYLNRRVLIDYGTYSKLKYLVAE